MIASGTTTVNVYDNDSKQSHVYSTYDVLIYQFLAATSPFCHYNKPKSHHTSYVLTLDPVIALQHTSYTIPESTPEEDASICVVLKNPVGGLAIPFVVMFDVTRGTASNLLDTKSPTHVFCC